MAKQTNDRPQNFEDNLKKAITEMLFLSLLRDEEMHIPQALAAIEERSGGVVNLAFPYAALYRLLDKGYVREEPKRIAPDGRRRQFYKITPAGKAYVAKLIDHYHRFCGGVEQILGEKGAD